MFALIFSPAVNSDVLLAQRDFAQDTILEVLDDTENIERLILGLNLLATLLKCFEDLFNSRDIINSCVNLVLVDSISSHPTIIESVM